MKVLLHGHGCQLTTDNTSIKKLQGLMPQMKKMRQKADGGLPRLVQETPNAPGESSSDMNFAPMAFNLNQSSAVCLPLVSDSQRLIWVHSSEINLQLDGAAELNKAFDRFPYLTEKKTAALAQRCSLHPDQVKVWFMVQRLHYGISWDYKDIRKVQRKILSSQGKEKLQNSMGKEVKEDKGENKKCTREVKEPGGKKAGEVREEQSASEGRMMGENVRDNERLERKMKQVQPMKKEKDRKVEEDMGNTQKKRKRRTVTAQMGKKRMKQREDGVVERAEEEEIRSDEVEREWQIITQSETTLFSRKKKKSKAKKRLLSVQERPALKSVVVPDESLDASPLLIPPSQTQAFDMPPLTDNQTELLERGDAVPPSTSNIHLIPVKSDVEEKTEMQTNAAETTNPNNAGPDAGKLKEFVEILNDLFVADGSSNIAQQLDCHEVDPCTLNTRLRCHKKTQTQMAMMKVAFLHCQYPEKDDYSRLAKAIDIPRYLLIQWFGDMRYYIKKGRPRWMNQEQHSQALDNIWYRQCLNALLKTQLHMASSECGNKATCEMKLDTSESCGEEKSVPVPPE
ncbi:homeobox and leucine zipper encoding b isoform X1 [Sander lucioperca]|uniref:Uncharacterized LOC116043328 n=2 Tax=Sander lucioperca TaxID=283035 RepID=A0A8C9ZM89_SANLU|nr:homeobox and leucine zipper encoding b isoform X1 [Sander lucioperca]XP_031145798.1 homeobox and leucine zipper encoding b isoform X1 [Sander lucioperca]